jgi:hypothetical protein
MGGGGGFMRRFGGMRWKRGVEVRQGCNVVEYFEGEGEGPEGGGGGGGDGYGGAVYCRCGACCGGGEVAGE